MKSILNIYTIWYAHCLTCSIEDCVMQGGIFCAKLSHTPCKPAVLCIIVLRLRVFFQACVVKACFRVWQWRHMVKSKNNDFYLIYSLLFARYPSITGGSCRFTGKKPVSPNRWCGAYPSNYTEAVRCCGASPMASISCARVLILLPFFVAGAGTSAAVHDTHFFTPRPRQ